MTKSRFIECMEAHIDACVALYDLPRADVERILDWPARLETFFPAGSSHAPVPGDHCHAKGVSAT